MTLNALIKALEKLQTDGHGRATVTVDRDSLDDGNGTWNVCMVRSAEFAIIDQVDGDGFRDELANGQQKTKRCIVLKG